MVLSLSIAGLSSCSYQKTSILLDSNFKSTWTFSDSNSYEFNENLVEIVNGRAQLKAIDLKHNGADFSSGNNIGTFVAENKMKLLTKPQSPSVHLNHILINKSSDLVGYWKLEQNTDDSTENSFNEASSINISYSNTGKVDSYSAIFDGVTSIINYGDRDEFSFTSSGMTMMAWVHRSRDLASDTFFEKYQASGYEYVFGALNNDLLYCFFRDDNSGGYIGRTAPDFDSGQWHHTACSYDGGTTSSSIKIYVNGVQVDTGDFNGGSFVSMRNTPTPLSIGNINPGLSATPFMGQLDELAIYKSVLNQSEIFDVFQAQNANYTELSPDWTPKWQHISGYWKMDGNWKDSSGHGNHGTKYGHTQHTIDSKVGSMAATFDGTGDHLDMGGDSSLKTQEFTYLAWIKRPALGSTDTIVGWPTNSNPQFRVDILNRLQFVNQSIVNIGSSIKTLETNKWHHVALVNDSSNNYTFYIDGEKDSSGSHSFSFSFANLHIGARNGGIEEFEGLIDELSIFSKPLSTIDIKSIYERQKQKYSGSYNSEVIDLGSSTSPWPDLSWSTSLPYGKELVGDFNSDGSPDSESSLDYTELAPHLNNGLIGYWPLNELNWSDTVSEVLDLSGQSINGRAKNGSNTTSDSLFYRSGNFNGTNQYIELESPLNTTTEGTVMSWVKLGRVGSPAQYILSMGSSLNSNSNWTPLRIDPSGLVSIFIRDSSSSTSDSFLKGSTLLTPGQWYHVVTQSTGTEYKLFINGVEESLSVTTGVNDGKWSSFVDQLDLLSIGSHNRSSGLSNYFHGSLNELAVWSRALDANEIQQLYLRGANRIKLQVKSCIDPLCNCKSFGAGGNQTDCDGDTVINSLDFNDSHKSEFIGPGGDGTTYYSELYNRASSDVTFNCALNISDSNIGVCAPDEISLSGRLKPTGTEFLNIDYAQFVPPTHNRYAQYRIHMEAEENSACNGQPCLPELISVNLNPTDTIKYANEYVEVKPKSPVTFTKLIGAKIIADTCATFRLARSTNEYYHDGTQWTIATNISHRNTAKEITDNILQFQSQFNSGQLQVLGYLQSDVSQSSQCRIDEIDIKYDSL